MRLCVLLSIIVIVINNVLYAHEWGTQSIEGLAIVVVPVADATNYSLQLLDNVKSVNTIHAELPFAPEVGDKACLRSHQLLFNEVVKIKQIVKEEVECEIFNVFYQDHAQRRIRSFWTLKKNICLLSSLNSTKLIAVPCPYTENRAKSLTDILTLAWPWQKYSAGTRFVRNRTQDTQEYYGVYILRTHGRGVQETLIPRKYAVVEYPKNIDQGIRKMVKLLRQWMLQSNTIPYVWGGCSFIDSYEGNNFTMLTQERYGQKMSFWVRPGASAPHTGYECSGLIFRAAQIYGLPYFLKNTATIVQNLEPLGVKEQLQDGDIIWYNGHVLIVSNKAENKVLESVGYKAGFGKVHEVPLSVVFHNISTYDELVKAYHEKKVIKRLTLWGGVFRTINKFLLLKMNSM